MCSQVKNFSECKMIIAESTVERFVVVIFITVVFVGSSLLLGMASICIILPHMGLQLQRLSLTHKLLFKNVVLRTSAVISIIAEYKMAKI